MVKGEQGCPFCRPDVCLGGYEVSSTAKAVLWAVPDESGRFSLVAFTTGHIKMDPYLLIEDALINLMVLLPAIRQWMSDQDYNGYSLSADLGEVAGQRFEHVNMSFLPRIVPAVAAPA